MQNEPPAELVEIACRAISLCSVCEGEGTVCDGLDDAACSMPCPPCFGTGYDTRAVLAAVTPQIEARVTGEIVAWLRFGLDDWPDYVAPPDIADAIERGDYRSKS